MQRVRQRRDWAEGREVVPVEEDLGTSPRIDQKENTDSGLQPTVEAMASTLVAMASTLVAMASTLVAMASNLINSDGLQP